MEAASRAAQVEKVKTQMMQVMGITDPEEFQRIARDYCKDMAVEMCLPAYHRIFTRMNRILEKGKEKFDKLTKEEKVAFALKCAMDDEETTEVFKQTFAEPDIDEKELTAERSGTKRSEGNTAFQKKQDESALRLYTEAIFSALHNNPEGKKDIALGLANRSAVLIKMKRYDECLEDIEASLYFEYPENMRYKLVDRQAKCYHALGQVSDAVRSYNRLTLLLKQSNLDKEKQEKWKTDTSKELESLKGKTDQPRNKKEIQNNLLINKNTRIPQFSDCVELVYNKSQGRFGKATRNIEAGEVIMQDTCVSHHLLCRTRNINCTHCMKKIPETRGIPSPLCIGYRFCSMKCLKFAMETYHPVEAKIDIEKFFYNRKDKRYEELSGNILLTYRAITQKPLAFFEEYKDLENVDPKYGVEFSSEDEVVEYSDYRNVFNLEAHRDKKTSEEILSLSIRTAIFIVFLRHGGYFGAKETAYGAVMSKNEAGLAKIIFHIQEGFQYNLHSVDEVVTNKLSGITSPELNEVGSAIFPTLLLLNHSCEPNTLRICANGNQVIMVAKRKIRKGEEVTDNYGIHHLSQTFEERQEALNRGFAFSCCCEACAKDYPRMKSLRSQLPEEVEDDFDAIREDVKDKFKKKDHAACLRLSIEMIQLLEKKNVVYPHRNYEMAGLSLHSCLWTLYGNHH